MCWGLYKAARLCLVESASPLLSLQPLTIFLSPAERPQQDAVAVPKKPGSELSGQRKHPGFVQHRFPLSPDSHGHSGSYTWPGTTTPPTERSPH